MLDHLSSLPGFSEVRVARSFVFCVVFSLSFCTFPLAIELSVLRFVASDVAYSNFSSSKIDTLDLSDMCQICRQILNIITCTRFLDDEIPASQHQYF